MHRFLSCGLALFILLFSGGNGLHAEAPVPGTAAWKDLEKHPAAWPSQVMLKAPVQLVITHDGAQVGAITAPAESMVQLLGVNDAGLVIGVGAAQTVVTPDQTNFSTRVATASPAATNVPDVHADTPPAQPAAPAPATPVNASATPVAGVVTSPTAPAAASGPPVLSAAPLRYDQTAPIAAGYQQAAFRFWSPNYAQPLNGLIVMTPGSDGDGRGMADDASWQALARKYGLGLVASYLKGGSYQRPEAGSGDAFRDALREFARQSNHPEITQVPLLLWGISAGGQWNYNYMLWRPEDVMAFVVNKGGYYSSDEPGSRALATPGLFILGQADAGYRVQAITGIWTAGRKSGALWALAPQPGSGHEFSRTDPLARIFFEAVLKARLPESSGLAGDPDDVPPMRAMDETAGWLGNLTTRDLRSASSPGDDDHAEAWLPDETTARAWKVFVSGG